MNKEKAWYFFSVYFLLFLLIASCVPYVGGMRPASKRNYYPHEEDMISASRKSCQLPENYTRITENAMIDRPALVVMLPVKHPAMGSKKRTAAMTAAEKQMTNAYRNYLINRFLVNRFFRQILPNDDPDDPSLPRNTVVIECYVKHQRQKRSLLGTAASSRTTSYIRLLDLKNNQLARVDMVSNMKQSITGSVEASYKIDSTEVYYFKGNINDRGFWDRFFYFGDSSLDKALAVLYRKYKKLQISGRGRAVTSK